MIQQKSVEQRSLDAVKRADVFVIRNNVDYLSAAHLLTGIQLLKKEVCDTFDSIIDKAHKTHKEACAKKAKFFVPLRNAEIEYKNKIATFDTEQENLRRREEDKLREAADKKEQKLRERAEEALKNGDEEKAEKLIDKAAEIPVPVVAPKHEKPSTISFTIRYKGIIVDRTLIPRTLSGIELLIPDEKAINRLANDSTGRVIIPGVRIISEKIVSGRTA
ncbi:unnamed protein product [marine sediment metagenome]|uniref:Uncharacterized protein n=1 Tax=marine sediment metagenome TaxID=412755 RepID=X1ASI4_9ZZZZ